jgi:hypothetical protein
MFDRASQPTEQIALILLQRLERDGYGATYIKKRRRKQKKRGSICLSSLRTDKSLFRLTGLSSKEFLDILKGTCEEISKPRKRNGKNQFYARSKTILSTTLRLVAAIHFLKCMPDRTSLEETFRVDYRTLSLDRKYVIPIILDFLFKSSSIRWPDRTLQTESDKIAQSVQWMGANMVIDCTSHNRNRTHPGQSWYYRGDKHTTFMTAQLVTDLTGSQMFSLEILRGHNNDQGQSFFFFLSFFCELKKK